MTVMEFFGCTFIAFGPPFALFVFTIARDPLRIIVLIARCFDDTVCFYIYFIWMVALMCKVIFIWSYSKISFKDIWTVLFIMFIDLKLSLFSGFFWLLSLLVSSILWYAVVPLREQLVFGLVFSVLFQEAFRFLFYKLLR